MRICKYEKSSGSISDLLQYARPTFPHIKKSAVSEKIPNLPIVEFQIDGILRFFKAALSDFFIIFAVVGLCAQRLLYARLSP